MKIEPKKGNFTIHDLQALEIIKIVNNYFKVETRLNTRKRNIVYPRQIAMYFIDHHVKEVTQATNASFFWKAHCSVFHSKKEITSILESKLAYNLSKKDEIEKLRVEVLKTNSLVSENYKLFALKSELSSIIYKMDLEELEEIKKNIIK